VPPRPWTKPSRWALFACGIVFGVPLIVLSLVALTAPPSLMGALLALSLVAWSVGALTAPWRSLPQVCKLALGALVTLLAVRQLTAARGERLRETSEPAGGSARALDRIFPERDVALGGTRLLALAGAMPDDAPLLLRSLRNGYSRMNDAEGEAPSPVLGTFLRGQAATDYALLHVESSTSARPRTAIVFLHGFIGNVALLCWQVAQAARSVDAVTVCPSTDWRARWTSRDSLAIVERTLGSLRSQGVERVYLAGLSAGAIGATRIAHRVDVDGVILLSGASSHVDAVKRVPTLVIQGGADPRTPPAPARAYARRLGALATYHEIPEADHWMILSHHDQVRRWIESWLVAREPKSGAP
jgi:predicted esterase